MFHSPESHSTHSNITKKQQRSKTTGTKICRTIFVDASEKIKADYTSICKAYESMLKKLKPGVKFSELYDTVRSYSSRFNFEQRSLRHGYEIRISSNKSLRHGLRDSVKYGYPEKGRCEWKNRENDNLHTFRDYTLRRSRAHSIDTLSNTISWQSHGIAVKILISRFALEHHARTPLELTRASRSNTR